jgi:two-component system, NarL family, sensor histidine kinase DegS
MGLFKGKNSANARANLHLWIILIIILGLAAFYYIDTLYFQETRSWGFLRALEIFEFKYDLHGILFCIPFIYSIILYWWKGALLTWLVSMVLIFPKILYMSPDIQSIISNIFFLMIPLLVVIFISTEVKWREKERKALADRENERQAFISQLLRAQENERQKLARELHDGPTQLLLVMASQADKLNSTPERDFINAESKKQAKWLKDMSLSMSEELRRLSLDLRPSILDNLGLIPATEWLVNHSKSESIDGELTVRGEVRKLSSDVDINLFRIIQEALNNIRRHAQATQILVEILFNPDSVNVLIKDNGKGFHVQTSRELTLTGKLGLLGMQQRVQLLNGTITFQSEIGQGTAIVIEIKT